MKKLLFLALSAALPLSAVPFEPQMDLEEYALQGRFFQYNQSCDLGEPGAPVPGCYIEGWHIAKASALRKDTVIPITFKEADGNYCIMVPGDPKLREYNLKVTPALAGMRFPKEGEVICSFRMKIAPDVNGKFNPVVPVQLDFRSINTEKQYGSAKERYPVLVGKRYIPTKEWQTYSFRVKVPAGDFPYGIMFRSALDSANLTFNSLLFDDLTVCYVDDGSSPMEEAQIVHGDFNHIYYEGSMIEPKIRALLRSEADQEELELVCRTRYDHKIMKRLPVTLKKADHKTADGRNLYLGSTSFPISRFGSYELLLLRGKDVMPCDVADFQMIRRPNADMSLLQRKLGAHYVDTYFPFQISYDNKTVASRYRRSAEDTMRVIRDAGFGHVILWIHFGAVMRESPEKADAGHFRQSVDMLKKYNLDGVGIIGSTLMRLIHRKRGEKEFSNYPLWLISEEYRSPFNKRRYIPHLKEFEIMTDALIKGLGDHIHHWELMSEPQWFIKSQEYFPILKQTYRQLKAAGPEHMLLAADATSDQGYNLTGWIQSLHDLGMEQYCDYVSFNPYGSGVDFNNGIRFRNSDLLRRIRKILNPGTKLWEGELYYIAHSKRTQTTTNQSYFAGADGQRHILLGLGNDLGGITCFDYTSFFRGPYAASELVSSMSALSYFLREKERTEVPEAQNSLIRQMIFCGKDKQNCSGAMWALQTAPAKWSLPELSASVKFYDTYGNPLKADKVMSVGLDPVFFTGPYEDLKNMLKSADWDLGTSVRLSRRVCGNDNFYEAENISGKKDAITVFPAGRKEGIRLNFTDGDRVRFHETGEAIEKFTTSLNKNNETVIDVPSTPVYTLPTEGELELKTKNDVPFTLAAGENGCLIITIEIPDTDVVCGRNFFDGDAVELFLDRTPFRHIGSETIQDTQTDLKIRQFAFDPNERIFGINLVDKVQDPEGASVKVTKDEKSWKCIITLTNDEVRPVEGDILGFTLQIARNDKGEKLPPDLFTGKDAHKRRQHYALIRLPEALTGNIKLVRSASGIVSLPEEPKWGPTLRRGAFSSAISGHSLQPGRYLLRFAVHGNKIDTLKVSLSGAQQLKFKKDFIPGSDTWAIFTLSYEVEAFQKWAAARFEFLADRADQDAWGEIKDVELIRQN